MADAYFLNEADAKIIRDITAWWRGRPGNTPSKTREDPDDHQAPEVYVARATESIAGMGTAPDSGGGGSNTLSDSLLSYWKFNDDPGGEWVDEVGDACLVDGDTSNTVVTSADGTDDTAAQFWNDNEFLYYPENDPYYDNTNPLTYPPLTGTSWTMAGWVFMTDALVFTDFDIAGRTEGLAGERSYSLKYLKSLGGYMSWRVSPDETSWTIVDWGDGDEYFVQDTWYFVVVHYDMENGQIGIQVDDLTIRTETFSGSPALFPESTAFAFGRGFVGFEGRVDEWGLWTKVLSAAERTALYNDGFGTTYPFSGISTEAGTGTADEGGSNNPDGEPASGDCQIYQLITQDGTPTLLEVDGLTKEVFNLSTSSITAGDWFLAARDKFGKWYALKSGGATATATVSGEGTAYIFKSPAEGIPAIELETETGTGTCDELNSALCQAYCIVCGCLQEVDGVVLRVHNLSEVEIPGDTYFLGHLDECGRWIVWSLGGEAGTLELHNSGSGGGEIEFTNVSRIVCTTTSPSDPRETWGALFEAPELSVSGATNASPIVLSTTIPHGLVTGDSVSISGVGGNTAANGTWTVTYVDDGSVELNGSTGNGAYTSGGTLTSDAHVRLTVRAASDSTSGLVTLDDQVLGGGAKALVGGLVIGSSFTGAEGYLIDDVVDSMPVWRLTSWDEDTAFGLVLNAGTDPGGPGLILNGEEAYSRLFVEHTGGTLFLHVSLTDVEDPAGYLTYHDQGLAHLPSQIADPDDRVLYVPGYIHSGHGFAAAGEAGVSGGFTDAFGYVLRFEGGILVEVTPP